MTTTTSIKSVTIKMEGPYWLVRVDYGAGSRYEMRCMNFDHAMAEAQKVYDEDVEAEQAVDVLRGELRRLDREEARQA